MPDKVCYPTSHLPFYIIGIVFASLVIFLIIWKFHDPKNYQFYYTQHKNVPPAEGFGGPVPGFNPNSWIPNTMTFGNHNSAHNSAIIASPYVPSRPPQMPYGGY